MESRPGPAEASRSQQNPEEARRSQQKVDVRHPSPSLLRSPQSSFTGPGPASQVFSALSRAWLSLILASSALVSLEKENMSSNAYTAQIACPLFSAAYPNLTVPIIALRAAFPDLQALPSLGHRSLHVLR